MNHDLYSNKDFLNIRDQLNKEIQRRGTFSWWDPLVPPVVGQDKTPPISLPDIGERRVVAKDTYTINTPSDGSMERTRNSVYLSHGDNPAGDNLNNPNTSAVRFDADEVRNFLIGLSKIMDINLFYGRDEISGVAFRDPKGIEDVIHSAKTSVLNSPLHQSDLSPNKNDPNGGLKQYKNSEYGNIDHSVEYPVEDGIYVMPSGEYDGEEITSDTGHPDETNFYDDHGASIVDSGEVTPDGQKIYISDSDYHPTNPFVSPSVDRSWDDQGHNRDDHITKKEEGGIPSNRFGFNPRNPQSGNPYGSRPVFGGKLGACNVACTGMCYSTCDNECSESCTTTCWNRCGDACTATCGNICTGCNTMCYTSCKTKCENTQGYSCLKAGAKTVKITAIGNKKGSSGTPGSSTWPRNTISYTTYSCNGCAYTCQFWPNKRTTCWDTACQSLCFTSCKSFCSTSCFGGCVDNPSENSDYKTGVGRACSNGCTINCVGVCHGTCEGSCVYTCWHACKALCYDNCAWQCHTNCGSGCAQFCRNGCMGCDSTCVNHCQENANIKGCVGCGQEAGCTSTCQHDCNKNCIGWGCRSICGIDSAGACEANCRLNCMAHSCTSLCSDACSSQCTTCAFNCGFSCGPCTNLCSIGCGAECNITCTDRCQNACDDYCYTSCVDICAGCSNLCYSCVGKCIGICSMKCESGCSSCTNNCGWWCDTSCNRQCFNNCDNRCIANCHGSCATYLQSDTLSVLPGPERPPTSIGYDTPDPKNREEERESFRLFRDINPPVAPPKKRYLVRIFIDRNKYLHVEVAGDGKCGDCMKAILRPEIDELFIQEYTGYVNDGSWDSNCDEKIKVSNHLDIDDAFDSKYLYDGEWDDICKECIAGVTHTDIDDIFSGKISIDDIYYDAEWHDKWTVYQTTTTGGVFTIDKLTGEITILTDALEESLSSMVTDPSGSIFIVFIKHIPNINITDDDIYIKLPFGYQSYKPIRDDNNNLIIIIEKSEFTPEIDWTPKMFKF